MADQQWARPFRITYDGELYHGAQFPDGTCVTRLPFGGFHGSLTAIRFEDLAIDPGAVVEWADGGEA